MKDCSSFVLFGDRILILWLVELYMIIWFLLLVLIKILCGLIMCLLNCLINWLLLVRIDIFFEFLLLWIRIMLLFFENVIDYGWFILIVVLVCDFVIFFIVLRYFYLVLNKWMCLLWKFVMVMFFVLLFFVMFYGKLNLFFFCLCVLWEFIIWYLCGFMFIF